MKDPKPVINYEDFDKLDLRTVTITKAEKHPNADKLVVLTCNVGDGEERTICAGIAAYYKPEELTGKQAIIVANLEPRNLRGIMSQGMVLAVRDPENPVSGDTLALLAPDKIVGAGLKAS